MKLRFFLALSLVSISASAESRKAVVLDTESKSVAVVDVASGSVGEHVTLSDTPQRMILSPDGKRIAVLSRGEGTTSFWTSHFNPTSKSSKLPSRNRITANSVYVTALSRSTLTCAAA